MRVELLKKGSFRTATWAGGTTTELFIHPGTSDCGARDFEVRVSSATVEIEESVFSDFKGYVRHIAPLEGGMRLRHEGHREVSLAPFEADSFDGAWCTRSYGKCVDFNLIHRDGWRGGIIALGTDGRLDCPVGGFTGIYVVSDGTTVAVVSEGEAQCLSADRGDFILVDRVDDEGGAKCTAATRGAEGILAIAAWASPICRRNESGRP